MASLEALKGDISDIISRPKAVRIEEIERIINQLRLLGWSVSSRPAGNHQLLFRVDDTRFGICYHNKGSSHLKPTESRIIQ
jgi:hypothetical protein